MLCSSETAPFSFSLSLSRVYNVKFSASIHESNGMADTDTNTPACSTQASSSLDYRRRMHFRGGTAPMPGVQAESVHGQISRRRAHGSPDTVRSAVYEAGRAQDDLGGQLCWRDQFIAADIRTPPRSGYREGRGSGTTPEAATARMRNGESSVLRRRTEDRQCAIGKALFSQRVTSLLQQGRGDASPFPTLAGPLRRWRQRKTVSNRVRAGLCNTFKIQE